MNTRKRKTTEEFIEQAKKVHGNEYDYSKVVYVNNLTKVCIICPKHGEFWQTPKQHLRGQGCQECGYEKVIAAHKGKHYTKKEGVSKHRKWDNQTIIEEFKKIYGETEYDYSKLEYKKLVKPVTLICPKHGEFEVIPSKVFSRKSGCQKCHFEHLHDLFSLDKDEFITKAKQIHGDKYDYSKVDFYNVSTKVCIICHEKDINGKEHGEFWQTPANHLKYRGCPMCKDDGLIYENRLYGELLDIFEPDEIIRQYRASWLSNRKSLDFYIPKYNIAIEHQGSQHFKPIKYFGGVEKNKKLVENDKVKYTECQENGVKLFYFAYEKYWVTPEYIDTVYTDINELKKILKEIKKWEK